jgi:hypothetical protein
MILFGIIISLIIGAVIGLYVHKVIKRRKLEQELRENPPELVHYVLKLPSDAAGTTTKMLRFWNRIHSQLGSDEKMLASNENVLHFTYLGIGTPQGQNPKVSFIVSCPSALSERVEIALSESYEGELEFQELADEKNPLLLEARKLQELAAWEKAQQAEQDDDDDDDE